MQSGDPSFVVRSQLPGTVQLSNLGLQSLIGLLLRLELRLGVIRLAEQPQRRQPERGDEGDPDQHHAGYPSPRFGAGRYLGRQQIDWSHQTSPQSARPTGTGSTGCAWASSASDKPTFPIVSRSPSSMRMGAISTPSERPMRLAR